MQQPQEYLHLRVRTPSTSGPLGTSLTSTVEPGSGVPRLPSLFSSVFKSSPVKSPSDCTLLRVKERAAVNLLAARLLKLPERLDFMLAMFSIKLWEGHTPVRARFKDGMSGEDLSLSARCTRDWLLDSALPCVVKAWPVSDSLISLGAESLWGSIEATLSWALLRSTLGFSGTGDAVCLGSATSRAMAVAA